MTSSTTEPYTPFQQELLSSMNQINSNVTTLIQVFVSLQSTLVLSHNNNDKHSPKSTNSPSSSPKSRSAYSSSLHPIHDIQKNEHKSNKCNKSTTTDITTNGDVNNEIIKNKQKKDDHDKSNTENKNEDQILSLDSSDTDDDDANNNDNNIQNNKKHLKMYTNHSWRTPHRSKYGLNRSRSTQSFSFNSTSSMNTLLRANHIRHHKYNGLFKNKYKKQSHQTSLTTNTEQKRSESVICIKKNKKKNKIHQNKNHDHSTKFNPEHIFLSQNNRIVINVGGSIYETTLNTVSADQSSMLSALFSGRFKIERDENGAIFIDRDPTHFRHVLNFLRDGIEYLKHGGLLQQPDAIVNELLQEAKFYNIRPLVDYIQLQQTKKTKRNGDELTHEKQYKLVTNINVNDFDEIFNKYTGSAGYDFENWLYVSPYKTSRNSTSSPSFQMLFSKKIIKSRSTIIRSFNKY